MISLIPLKTKNIPARFQHSAYLDVSKELRDKFEQMRKIRKGLYIWGGVGTGKTHLIYALSQINIDDWKGLEVMIFNTTDMLRQIKSQFDQPAGNYYDDLFAQILQFKGLLILDDLGSEKLTEWVQETFYLIINKRYEEMLPMIFTSNFKISDLAGRLGDRIVSRIVESCDIVELKGVDRRLS
jgi:DNA replication protein DnaC